MAAMDVKEELDTRMATACPGQSVEAWIQECIKTNSFMDPSTNALRDVLQHDMEMIFLTYGGPPQFLEAALTDLEQKSRFASFLDHLHGEATNIWDGDGPTLVTKGFQSASEPVQIWFPKESSPTGNCFINGEPSLSQSIIPICMERMCDEPSEVWCVECHDPLCHEHVIWINTWEGTPVPYCGACLTAMMNSRSEFFWTVTVSS